MAVCPRVLVQLGEETRRGDIMIGATPGLDISGRHARVDMHYMRVLRGYVWCRTLILNRSLLRWFSSSIQLSLEGMVGDSRV